MLQSPPRRRSVRLTPRGETTFGLIILVLLTVIFWMVLVMFAPSTLSANAATCHNPVHGNVYCYPGSPVVGSPARHNPVGAPLGHVRLLPQRPVHRALVRPGL